MKSKIRLLLLLPLMLLAGCNHNMIGTYNFDHIHVQVNAGEPIYHFEVRSWTDSEDSGIEVKLKDGTNMFVNGGYVLYKSDKCPLCNK